MTLNTQPSTVDKLTPRPPLDSNQHPTAAQATGRISKAGHQIDEMICPLCQSDKGSFVVDSRDLGDVRRRRHSCYNCDKRYTTYEITAERYERIQSMNINVTELDSVIASLRAIKVQFGDRNGTS